MNGLTPAETERIAKLTEELGEAQQVVGKILLHGWRAVDPEGNVYHNREDLQRELGDVQAAMRLMTRAGDLNAVSIAQQRRKKFLTITRYMVHQALDALET
ncbi:hypothetical protein D3C71_78250 [compost metagenome]